MKTDEDSGGMWCMVMFDLPVKTTRQRREAMRFRNLLLDMGYGMVQYSVYARYTPLRQAIDQLFKSLSRTCLLTDVYESFTLVTINGRRRFVFPV